MSYRFLVCNILFIVGFLAPPLEALGYKYLLFRRLLWWKDFMVWASTLMVPVKAEFPIGGVKVVFSFNSKVHEPAFCNE